MRAWFQTVVLATGLIGHGLPVAPGRADDTGFATSTHDVRHEGGRLCILAHNHGGSGTGGTKGVALVAAMKAFYDSTASEYGSDWASWSKAASKQVTYAKTSDGWSASVLARPCK
jgi:hypothetical protein